MLFKNYTRVPFDKFDIYDLHIKIIQLVSRRNRGFSFFRNRVRVKNVSFVAKTESLFEFVRKNLDVFEHSGFFGLRKNLVFSVQYRGDNKDAVFEVFKYVPGEWEKLVDEIL